MQPAIAQRVRTDRRVIARLPQQHRSHSGTASVRRSSLGYLGSAAASDPAAVIRRMLGARGLRWVSLLQVGCRGLRWV